jgi:redox-sensitive bicupin YhaK (pirin superfamily)
MLEAVIKPRTRDLGDGFQVRRALPDARLRSVGPFVFFDQMGPVTLAPGKGLDVRPHPHIGLATVTYLFEGEILHRDSLGSEQPIRPGDVNWMTAGRGIVHSERSPQSARSAGARLSGIQTWVGLPRSHEEAGPAFIHVPASDLPVAESSAGRLRLILGELGGKRSPVPTLSPMFYADVELRGPLRLEFAYRERGAFIASGAIECAGARHEAGEMLVFTPQADVRLAALGGARVLLFGGEPLDGERFLWWNFVSSSRKRIAQAADEWKAGNFARVPGETEFIPLPEKAPTLADYP